MFDEDRDKKVEFLGKVAIPLLRVCDLVSSRMVRWGRGGSGRGDSSTSVVPLSLAGSSAILKMNVLYREGVFLFLFF